MKQVQTAVEQGRCAIAVSSALLRDAEVMLALTERAAMSPMTLGTLAQAPVAPVSESGVLRALAQPGGLLILVEPDPVADSSGLQALSKLMGRASHKPTIAVVGKSFNPFAFASTLRGFKVEHIKERGRTFLSRDLPMPPALEEGESADLSLPKVKKASDRAPSFCFAGRDDELARLGELLGAPGPIVVSGALGVGRTALIEQAIAASGLTRAPDMNLHRAAGFDALIGRLAALCAGYGATGLQELLAQPHTPAALIAEAIASLKAAEGANGAVMVVRNLDMAMGREADFFRKSRLELLCEAMLTATFPLRMVFISTRQPTFHIEGAGLTLRRLEVGGIKGRFFHEIFAAYKAPEFPREHFGPIADRLFGHPLAARTFAIAVRDRGDGVKLVEDPKFMKLSEAGQLDPVKKQLSKNLERLEEGDRRALGVLAHLRHPFDAQLMSDLDIPRRSRLELLALGLLDVVGTEHDRRYRVHPLIRGLLTFRETDDFEVHGMIADLLTKRAAAAEGLEKLALEQDVNRHAMAGRQVKKRIKLDVPDQDSAIEAIVGMIRSKQPQYEFAEQRLKDVLANDPSNSDAWLLLIELYGKSQDKGDLLGKAVEDATAKAAVPEIFHQAAGYWLSRRSRHKAIEVLEAAVALLPDEPRLKCRLGALLLRDGRRNAALETLQQAMAQAPMLADPHGLLGMARREEGVEQLEAAEALLREAVRLAPGDATQASRLADLLLVMAKGTDEAPRRKLLLDEARELLDEALIGEYKSPEAQLLLAQVVLESGGDAERASWLLGQAKKATDRGNERNHRIAVERARVHLVKGELDAAEHLAREQATKSPGSPLAFHMLALVLQAREQLIPAHAELLRAKERVAPSTLEFLVLEREVRTLQARIEQAASQIGQAPAAHVPPMFQDPGDSSGPGARTIRRPKASEGAAADPNDVPTQVDSVPAEIRAAEVRAKQAAVEAEAEVSADAADDVDAFSGDAPAEEA